jgi:hypothetical protein
MHRVQTSRPSFRPRISCAILVGVVATAIVLTPLQATEPTVRLGFSRCLGGSSWGTLRGIAFDSAGNMIVIGYGPEFSPRNFPTATKIGPLGDQNIPVAKFTPNGALLWMTLIGGSRLNRGYGVVVGSYDEIYVAGQTASPDFPTTPGAYDRTFNGGTPNPAHGPSDAYVLKLSADGQRLIYSTLLGGSKNDGARGGLAVDAQEFAYIVGFTESSDYLASDPARVNDFLGGHSDAFITKLSQDGSRIVYSRFLGGSDNTGANATEMAPGVQVDAHGHAYLHVIVRSRDAITTPNAFQRTFKGGRSDTYFAKLSPDGKQLLYATYFGGRGDEFAEHRIALDNSGNVYAVGQTRSPDFPVINAHQPSRGGGPDAYVVKLDPTGQPVFSTYIGGSDDESALGPALDAKGNIFVAGLTGSHDFKVTRNAFDRTFNGVKDAFLQIYSATGQLLSSTFFGGRGFDFARYVAVDARDNAIVTGETDSRDFSTTPVSCARTNARATDGFIAKFNLNHGRK